MTTDTKLRLHNITSKASLGYGSENWIINKRDAQKLEAAQMRFLRLKRPDRQRSPDIRNTLKVNNIVGDIISYQNKWFDPWNKWIEAAYQGWLSSTNLRDGRIWVDQEEDGETRNYVHYYKLDVCSGSLDISAYNSRITGPNC
jgi:hypothetical protein